MGGIRRKSRQDPSAGGAAKVRRVLQASSDDESTGATVDQPTEAHMKTDELGFQVETLQRNAECFQDTVTRLMAVQEKFVTITKGAFGRILEGLNALGDIIDQESTKLTGAVEKYTEENTTVMMQAGALVAQAEKVAAGAMNALMSPPEAGAPNMDADDEAQSTAMDQDAQLTEERESQRTEKIPSEGEDEVSAHQIYPGIGSPSHHGKTKYPNCVMPLDMMLLMVGFLEIPKKNGDMVANLIHRIATTCNNNRGKSYARSNKTTCLRDLLGLDNSAADVLQGKYGVLDEQMPVWHACVLYKIFEALNLKDTKPKSTIPYLQLGAIFNTRSNEECSKGGTICVQLKKKNCLDGDQLKIADGQLCGCIRQLLKKCASADGKAMVANLIDGGRPVLIPHKDLKFSEAAAEQDTESEEELGRQTTGPSKSTGGNKLIAPASNEVHTPEEKLIQVLTGLGNNDFQSISAQRQAKEFLARLPEGEGQEGFSRTLLSGVLQMCFELSLSKDFPMETVAPDILVGAPELARQLMALCWIGTLVVQSNPDSPFDDDLFNSVTKSNKISESVPKMKEYIKAVMKDGNIREIVDKIIEERGDIRENVSGKDKQFKYSEMVYSFLVAVQFISRSV